MKDGSLSVGPADVERTGEALYQAVTMSPNERKRRAEVLLATIQREDSAHWLRTQFEDLRTLGP